MKKATSKKGQTAKKCTCREPKAHCDCTYCGCGSWPEPPGAVCGVCHEAGIDGPVIRGSGRVVCSLHKESPKGHSKQLKAQLRFTAECKPVKGSDILTIREFCAKLMKAVVAIDDAISARKIPSAISAGDRSSLLSISDQLADIASDIELGDL